MKKTFLFACLTFAISLNSPFVLLGQMNTHTGRIWNMQGPNAGGWDLLTDSQKYISDKEDDKDLINTTTKSNLPNFKESWESGSKTKFVKAKKLDFDNFEYKELKKIFEDGKESSKVKNVQVGDIYVAKLRNDTNYLAIKIIKIQDDNKTIKNGGDNLDYIEFQYKKESPSSSPVKNEKLMSDAFENGKKEFEKGNFLKAIEEFNASENAGNAKAELYYLRALSKVELGDHESALEDFDKAIQLDNDNALYYYKRGLAKSKMGERNGAIDDFTLALKFDPHHGDALMARAHEKYLMSNYPGSIEDYTLAIDMPVQNLLEAYYHRGLAKNEYGKFLAAIQDFNKAIELYPKYNYAYFYRGFAKSHLEDHKGAIEDYSKVIELDPTDKYSYYNRGYSKKEIQDFAGALADYQKALEIDPKFHDAYFQIADTKHQMGNLEAAVEDYNKILTIWPNEKEAYFNKGNIYLELNKNEMAIPEFTKAIEIDPNDKESYYLRGLAKSGIKSQKKDACEDLKKAEELGEPKASELKNKICM